MWLVLLGTACTEPQELTVQDTEAPADTEPADPEPDPVTDEPTDTPTPEDPVLPAWLDGVTCGQAAPDGALHAAPAAAYSGGTCPSLVSGFNTLPSGGRDRRFLLILPSDLRPEETPPVLFMWHWLSASPEDYIEEADIQTAADQQRFIAVIPESPEDISIFGLGDFPWPFLTVIPDRRFDEELTFFDDMFACVSEAFPIDHDCVSTVGVSAGALFSVQLSTRRSDVLASSISLSGGVGAAEGISNQFVMRWHEPTVRDMPFFVLWGGPRDSCVLVNFEEASLKLEDELVDAGSFFVECVHNCRHGVPPMDAPPGYTRFAAIWDFFLRHPYWLPEGTSPYLVEGLPADNLPWCGIGPGSATPRTGVCEEPSCPI